jgi:hypothetical protein
VSERQLLDGRGVEQEAGACETGFGLLEFGDVKRSDVKTAGLKARAGAWKRSGKNNGSAESKGVGGVRLFGGDIDPVVAGERCGIDPSAVGKERVAADVRNCRLEMKAARDADRSDFVALRLENRVELPDAFGIGAAGEAGEKFAADAKNIAAFHGAGKRDAFELAKFCEGLGYGRCFWTPRFGAERHDHRKLIENDSRVFDKHRVGQSGFSGQGDDAGAEFSEKCFVGAVLGLRSAEVDGLALNEEKLAVHESRTDGACDGGKHVEPEKCTRENLE